jgi:hypothetical protein
MNALNALLALAMPLSIFSLYPCNPSALQQVTENNKLYNSPELSVDVFGESTMFVIVE